MTSKRFRDRSEAGARLAAELEPYRGADAVVLGLARGGVEVGAVVAAALGLPLAPLVVRKLGAPRQPELAIGAISETGAAWLDQAGAALAGADEVYLKNEIAAQRDEAHRRQALYAAGPGLAAVAGRTAIVVDDGLATGISALVGVRSARDLGAKQVVLAAPVGSLPATQLLAPEVDRLVVPLHPDPFHAVGLFYEHFEQVSDDAVVALLHEAAGRRM